MPKVQPGMSVPDFALKDVNGQDVRLSDFRNDKNVLLVFNRGVGVTLLPQAHGAVASGCR